MSPIMYERLWEALFDTLIMVGASGLIALVAGIPLAVMLVLTSPGVYWKRHASTKSQAALSTPSALRLSSCCWLH